MFFNIKHIRFNPTLTKMNNLTFVPFYYHFKEIEFDDSDKSIIFNHGRGLPRLSGPNDTGNK